jgi:hypothetical protein
MCDTLAKLVTDVLAGLGFPPEKWLRVEDAVRVTTQSLLYAAQGLAQANQNQVISKKTFTPASREHTLADVRGVPVWAERKVGTEPDEIWRYVPAVNLASIEEAAERGEDRCAFFNENGVLKIRLSLKPTGAEQFRLRYDPDPLLETTINDELKVPAGFYPYFSARARRSAVPVILANAAKLREDPPGDFQLLAWKTVLEEAHETIREWEPMWKQHRLGSRGTARGRRRRRILG